MDCLQTRFFSIVHKDGFYHVRASTKRDLENHRVTWGWRGEKGAVEELPAADYRWRIRVDGLDFSRVATAFHNTIAIQIRS